MANQLENGFLQEMENIAPGACKEIIQGTS